jgi:hypothetical protein
MSGTTKRRGLSIVSLVRGIAEYAACRRVLPFKYSPAGAYRNHYRDGGYRTWFLAQSIARPKYVDRSLLGQVRVVSMNFVAARVLCVEFDQAVLDSRCAVLKHSGYDVVSASPQGAEIALRSQKFDLVIVSALSDHDLHRIINFSDGADVLVVDEGPIVPSVFVLLVQERLARRQLRA